MQTNPKLPFPILLMLISFASVNAVLFTPALPNIAHFFRVSTDVAQYTVTWFLVGYALGQLIYGPLANRFGRKAAIYAGVSLQIVSSLFCVFAGFIHVYSMLVLGRFLLALGSGVGLKMTFTLVNESYEPKVASQKISYLALAFAITPGLGVALGGFLNEYYGWASCFYAGALYGLVLLICLTKLPETQRALDFDALKVKHIIHSYGMQFKNSRLLAGGFLMGGSSSFVYVFAAIAPFIAINLLGMSSSEYGIANVLPPIGLILGSLCSARLVKRFSLQSIIKAGIIVAGSGVTLMIIAVSMHEAALYSLFLPMIVVYFGLSFVMANASTVAMSQTDDKAHGSAVMNFVNMAMASVIVLSLGFFTINTVLMSAIYVALIGIMFSVYRWVFN